ncbi:MAG TPA: modification methylase, partial [Porphyromonadaceae bacterium]|nr:modification methylase [Porphyromonadaceae bacterium]
ILCGDFEQTEKYAEKNVFYYLDPPYRPLTETSTFTSYSSNGFDDIEQIRLRNFCNRISEYKSIFIESNSDPQNVNTSDLFFDKLYEVFNIKRVSATRVINSKGNSRGSISEIMISNIKDIHKYERF